MIKMLVLDIDGTIYSDEKGMSERVKSHIKLLKKSGIKVVIATGRMFSSALKIINPLEIDTPLICFQGSLIKDIKTQKVMYEIPLDGKIAREIIKDLRKEKVSINIYRDEELIVEKESEYIKDYSQSKKVGYTLVKNFDEIEFKTLNKILAIDLNPNKINKLIKDLRKKYSPKVYVVKSMPQYCEISNIQATKGNAVRFLANKWGIKKEEIMAAGDNDNDIEMLLAAGIKIAMGNGTDELKKVADFVTDTVDNDGIVKAIEKFINIEGLIWNTESDKDMTSTV